MILWVFDNDGTLYRDFGAGEQFQVIFNKYVCERHGIGENDVAAWIAELKTRYDTDFSLVAIMKEFDINFAEVVANTYLKIDLESCGVPESDVSKSSILAQLPGDKVVFTNNPAEYARFVLGRLGLIEHFTGVVGMEEVGFVLKPRIHAYRYLQERYQGYSRIIFCDDRKENLDTAKDLGWETALATYINPQHKGDKSHRQLDVFDDLLSLA